MSHIIDQRIILFRKMAINSDNMIIDTLVGLNRNEVGMILSKYNIPSLNLSLYAIKSRMWPGDILLMLHVIVENFCSVNRVCILIVYLCF